MAQRSESRDKFTWSLPSKQAIMKHFIMAEVGIMTKVCDGRIWVYPRDAEALPKTFFE